MTTKVDKPVDGIIRHSYLANEIVFERKVDAPLEKLWSFVDQPNNLIKWVGGRLDKFELEVGGKYEICIAPQWNVMVLGTVLEYEPKRILHFTWDTPAWGNSPNLFGSTIKIEAWGEGAGSRIRFTHTVPYDAGREHLFAGAWHLHLDQLEELLKGNDQNYRIETSVLFEMVKKYMAKDFDARLNMYKHVLFIKD